MEGRKASIGTAASIPEPAPSKGKVSVTANLLQLLTDAIVASPHESYFGNVAMKELVEQRRLLGISKYGQELMTEDGRNAFEDARQEIGDAAQYIWKLGMEGAPDEEFQRILLLLAALRGLTLTARANGQLLRRARHFTN